VNSSTSISTEGGQASASNTGLANSYAVSHLLGKHSLARTFWINVVLIGNLGVHLLNASIAAVAEMTGGALVAAYILGFLAVLAWVWCLVGLWAASSQHLATRKSKVWGWIARGLVVMFVVGTILNLGQQFGTVQG